MDKDTVILAVVVGLGLGLVGGIKRYVGRIEERTGKHKFSGIKSRVKNLWGGK